MAESATIRFGPCDNASVFQGLIGTLTFDWSDLPKLVLSSVNSPPFGLNDQETYSLIQEFCEMRALGYPDLTASSVRMLTVMEAFGPYVPARRLIADQSAARAEFVAVVQRAVTRMTAFERADLLADQQAADIHPYIRDVSAEQIQTFDVALSVLRACEAVKRRKQPRRALKSITEAAASIMKRGNASPAFLRRVAEVVERDIAKISLDKDVVRRLWNELRCVDVDDKNVGQIIDWWLGYIPPRAVGLKLMLKQVPEEGLLGLETTRKALKSFEDFRWDALVKLYPTEASTLLRALKETKENKYYAYKRDSEVIKVGGYYHFAWSAAHLLITVGGESSLKHAATFSRTPSERTTLEALMAGYPGRQSTPTGCKAEVGEFVKQVRELQQ